MGEWIVKESTVDRNEPKATASGAMRVLAESARSAPNKRDRQNALRSMQKYLNLFPGVKPAALSQEQQAALFDAAQRFVDAPGNQIDLGALVSDLEVDRAAHDPA